MMSDRTIHNPPESIHSIDDGIKGNVPNQYQNCNSVSDVDTWKVSKDGMIFVFPGYYLGQHVPFSNHVDTRANYLIMKVLGWYVDPPGIKNRNILKYISRLLKIPIMYSYPSGIK